MAIARSLLALAASGSIVVACHTVSGLTDFRAAGGGGEGGAGGLATGPGGMGGGQGGTAGAPPEEALESCFAIKNDDPSAPDGRYFIDPDGDGPDAPFEVLCDMTLDGGGWTRFHWLRDPPPLDRDPLGETLAGCDVGEEICFGRIPAAVDPVSLLVKDLSDGTHAMWDFDDGNSISQAVLGALRDKMPACLADEPAPWMPYDHNSQEPWCGTGAEGGCDSFMYDQGACVGLPGWTLELDGDLWFAAAAFKVGWMRSNTACGGGPFWDHGYLDEVGCSDELGELYYRE